MPELSFLFIYFANNQRALARTRHRLEGKGADYCNRIINDIEEMKAEAWI